MSSLLTASAQDSRLTGISCAAANPDINFYSVGTQPGGAKSTQHPALPSHLSCNWFGMDLTEPCTPYLALKCVRPLVGNFSGQFGCLGVRRKAVLKLFLMSTTTRFAKS